jgi:hypothetical protein
MIATTLKVDKAQAALILSSDEERKKLEAKAVARKRDQQVSENWEKGIRRIQKTLLPWSALLDAVMRGFTEIAAAMLGLDKPGKAIQKLASMIGTWMKNLSKNLREFADAWRKGGEEMPDYMKALKFFISLLKILGKITLNTWKLFWKITKTLMQFFSWVGKVTGVTKFLTGAIEWLTKALDDASDMLDKIDFMSPFEGIPGLVSGAIDWIKEKFNLLPKFLKDPLGMIGGFFKEYFWDTPKKWVTQLIEWLQENAGKIADVLNPVKAVKGLFATETELPKQPVKAEPVSPQEKAEKERKKVQEVKIGRGKGAEPIEITLVVEGTDELSDILARSISIKNVQRARSGT